MEIQPKPTLRWSSFFRCWFDPRTGIGGKHCTLGRAEAARLNAVNRLGPPLAQRLPYWAN